MYTVGRLYKQLNVKITFPEYYSKDKCVGCCEALRLEEDSGSFSYVNTIRFTTDTYQIHAEIFPCHIPAALVTDIAGQKAIMNVLGNPIINEIKADLSDVEDLFRQIRVEFVQRNKHPSTFHYRKIVHDGDTCKSVQLDEHYLFGQPFKGYSPLFEKLSKIKELKEDSIPEEYKRLFEITKCANFGQKTIRSVPYGQKGGEEFYLIGNDLRKVMETALDIYGIANDIMNLPI